MTVSLDARNLSIISTHTSTLLACMIIYILKLYVHLFLKLFCVACLHSSLQKHEEFNMLPQWRNTLFRTLLHSRKIIFVNWKKEKKNKNKVSAFFLVL